MLKCPYNCSPGHFIREEHLKVKVDPNNLEVLGEVPGWRLESGAIRYWCPICNAEAFEERG